MSSRGTWKPTGYDDPLQVYVYIGSAWERGCTLNWPEPRVVHSVNRTGTLSKQNSVRARTKWREAIHIAGRKYLREENALSRKILMLKPTSTSDGIHCGPCLRVVNYRMSWRKVGPPPPPVGLQSNTQCCEYKFHDPSVDKIVWTNFDRWCDIFLQNFKHPKTFAHVPWSMPDTHEK